MKSRPASLCLCASLFLGAAAVAGGDTDWPGWRGPGHDGVSAETGWSAVPGDAPLWEKNIGFGHSSFAVAGGRLYAMGYDQAEGVDVVHCLDPATGDEIWRHTYPAEFWNEGHDGGTCTTPTVDGATIYTSNREGKLTALRADTGDVTWSRDLRSELGATPPRWGFAGSPVVIGDMVIANVSKLAAFDKETGEPKWVSETEHGNAYSTPIAYDFNGRPSILALNGLGLVVIDQADGSEIAFHPWSRNPERAVYGATPVIIDDKIFISAAAQGGCAMLEPNDQNGLDVVWESRVMRSSYAGCILYEDHLYGFDASILKCIDLEGNEKWRQRGIGVGAVIVVGGRLLIVGAKGEIIVAEANPEKYVELSRKKVLDGGANWATPVLSNGLVYARNSIGDMVCQDHRVNAGAVGRSLTAIPGKLPPAATLLSGHVTAIGGTAALENLTAVHMTGRGESHGGGPIERCDAEVAWSKANGFHWVFSTGLDFGYTPKLGWVVSQGGPQVLEVDSERIEQMREVTDFHRMLAPDWGYTDLTTTEARVFDDRVCYVVSASLPEGVKRTLYFEADTGLLAGQEGDDIPLWTFGDYRDVGGCLLPHEWSYFAAGSGSLTMATFAKATVDRDDASRFEPPTIIAMMTASPAEKERENERLRAKYGDLVGSYTLATGSMVGTPIGILVADGGIKLSFGGQPGQFLSEKDDDGRMIVMEQPQIYITIEKTASGDQQIVLWAYGDEFGRLERAQDG